MSAKKLSLVMGTESSMSPAGAQPRAAVPFSRLRRALHESGFTQEEAGRLVGVDAKQVRRWMVKTPRAVELLVELERVGAERKRAA